MFFAGCGLQNENADDNKQNSVSSTDNTNNPTDETVSGAGIDTGTGADTTTGVDTGTGADTATGVDNATGADTGAGVDTEIVENIGSEEDVQDDNITDESDNLEDIEKLLEADVKKLKKSRKKRQKNLSELVNYKSSKKDIIKAKWAEPTRNNARKHQNPKRIKNIKMKAECWNSPIEDFSINMNKIKSAVYEETEIEEKLRFLPFNENYVKVLSKNTENVVGPAIYRDDNDILHNAIRYAKNDNSYVIYEKNAKDDAHNYLCLLPQMVTIFSPNEDAYFRFPFPSCRHIDAYDVEKSWEKNEDYISDRLLRCYSIEELKDFYSAFSYDIADYFKRDNVFIVKGKCIDDRFDRRSKTQDINRYTDIYVHLDFKNMTIKIENEREIELASSEIFEDLICEKYDRIGKIGDKAFFCDDKGRILMVKNGIRKFIVDEDRAKKIYQDTGWNCVGEYVDMKFANECTQNNIVISFTMHLDGGKKWNVKGKLYFDRNGNYKRIKYISNY